jgi:hypothetical protein
MAFASPASSGRRSSSRTAALAIGQGAYFVATGVWPLVHIRWFEAVTGPKVDKWLVGTVAAGLGAVDAFY